MSSIFVLNPMKVFTNTHDVFTHESIYKYTFNISDVFILVLLLLIVIMSSNLLNKIYFLIGIG